MATSLAVIALVSISSVASAIVGDAMPWPVALPFALGAVVALLAAGRFARHVSGRRLQGCFALLLFVRGVGAALSPA